MTVSSFFAANTESMLKNSSELSKQKSICLQKHDVMNVMDGSHNAKNVRHPK